MQVRTLEILSYSPIIILSFDWIKRVHQHGCVFSLTSKKDIDIVGV